MAQFRPFKTAIDADIFQKVDLTTTNNSQDELWSLLRMPGRVRDGVLSLPRERGLRSQERIDSALGRYQGFIEQAYANWRAAQHADFHSNPLLYYYCFLNLVKADLVLSNPDMDEKIHHGITVNNRSLPNNFDEIVVNTCEGVFSNYYKKVFSVTPRHDFLMKNIVEYLQEMSFQLQYGSFGTPRAIVYRMRIVTDDTHCWSMFTINKNAQLSTYSDVLTDFFDHYELADNDYTLNILQAQAVGNGFSKWRENHIFQSKFPAVMGDRREMTLMLMKIEKILKGRSTFNLYNNEDTGVLNLPPLDDSELKLNEEVSAYMFMFLLSTLVRYNPTYYTQLLSTKYGFLIESFVSTAPGRFLRHITNRIHGRYLMVVSS